MCLYGIIVQLFDVCPYLEHLKRLLKLISLFFYLSSGTKATERVKWGLTGDCEAYAYLAGSDTVTSTVSGAGAADVNGDAEATPTEEQEKYVQSFSALKDSLHALGVSTEETQQLFSAIAGVFSIFILRRYISHGT